MFLLSNLFKKAFLLFSFGPLTFLGLFQEQGPKTSECGF